MHNMKVALITGSTSGIGLGIAKEFAKVGYAIAFNGLEENGAEIAQEVGQTYGVKTHFYGADLRNPDQIIQMIQDVESTFGHVDVLVNNAGIQFVSPIEDFPVDKWNAIIDINMNSVFHASKGVWKGLYDFLGYNTNVFIQSKESWKQACIDLGVTSIDDYNQKCEHYSYLPKSPGDFYKKFSNIPNELSFNENRRR